ncbi:hypothetical protein EV697_104125 [Bisgaardia hudsonensis]|uniref:Uncharacterized protein n=1 Tax=Bisgaardia hudsonensis TaxID=109472 RepID=A0A4V2SJ10_9PAST|nr:folate-binding protein YgfZ [Bisgaardia hudsonensis]QLB12274.1 hypothetical protein A6A11_00885 [Bisgaardia hudsonensis]TCP12318.1 hypothetical protein EV697_104125 [Bisgaardia hudsonensis]
MFIQLEQYSLISISGEDAQKYLQGQLTTDVNKLVIGSSTLTAHCDPKGKVNSLFRLYKVGEQQFYVVIRKNLIPFALTQLKKYAVFSKVTFNELNWQLIGIVANNQDDLNHKCGQISANFTIEIGDNRAILVSEQILTIEFEQDFIYWDKLDIQAGLPIFSVEAQNEFIPQALNLQVIEEAISFQKGCYIGQEIVARAKYRGINKRAMFVFSAITTEQPQIGTEIEMQLESGWRKTGFILNTVNFDGVLWLQVVMNNQLENNMVFRLAESHKELTGVTLPYEL